MNIKRYITMLAMMACLCNLLWPSISANSASAQTRLFQFERSKNRNYICYDTNETNGHLDAKQPLHVYWTLDEEGGKNSELTFIQRKLAFGYKVVKRRSADDISITLTAYDPLVIRIQRHGNSWIATAPINGRQARLHRMFAQMRSPNSLHVNYVDIFGSDLQTGKAVKQRINND